VIKARFKGLEKAFRKLHDAIELGDKAFFQEIGEYARNRVVTKARSGYTMASGESKRLKSLSETYVEWRKSLLAGEKKAVSAKRKEMKSKGYLKRGNKMQEALKRVKDQERKKAQVDPEFFSPTRSNLTLTGQLLRSIKITNIDVTNRKLIIAPTGSRKRGPEWFGGKRKTLTNAEVASHQVDQGRDIFELDKTGLRVIRTMALRLIRSQIKKYRLKK